MQIQIASDLHFEFYKNKKQKEDIIKRMKENNDCENIILAGDIFSQNQITDLFLFKKYYKNVIFVNGNHEAWGTTLGSLHNYKNYLPENFYWLENDSIELNDVNFIGCTLWFKRTEFTNKGIHWSDYRKISGDYKANMYSIFEANKISREYLKQNVKENSVVITHHLPHKNSVSPQYKNDPFNDYFLCNMEEMILNNRPKYWFHGHAHMPFDYMVSNTRIICNPLGYPGEFNDFNWNKIIEI